jgi:O-antigen/teichoic acid export membrane protein
LGAEALGIYALGMTVGGVLGLLAAVGLPQASARYVAVYSGTGRLQELRGFLWRSLLFLLVSSLLLATVMIAARHWVATHLYHTPVLAQYMVWFAVIMFLGTFTTLFGQILAGYKDVTRRTVITNFIGSPLTMLLSVCVLALGAGLYGYIVAQVVSALAVLALLAAAVWKLTPSAARLSSGLLPPFGKEALFFSASLFAIQGLEYVLAQLDKILLGCYLDARQVGIYAVAVSLTTSVPILLQSINQIFSPTIAGLHARGEMAMLGRLYQTLTKWSLGLTLPLAMVVCAFAPHLMQIFGDEFRAGWPILVIGVAGQLINCAVGSVGLLLIMSGNQNRLIRAQVKVAAANIVLNFLLIPIWGIVGAACVSAISNAAINLLYLREVRNCLGLFPHGRNYAHLFLPASAALVAVLVLRFNMESVHPGIIIVASLIMAYSAFIAMASLVGLDNDDRLLAGAIWSKFRGTFLKAAPEAV